MSITHTPVTPCSPGTPGTSRTPLTPVTPSTPLTPASPETARKSETARAPKTTHTHAHTPEHANLQDPPNAPNTPAQAGPPSHTPDGRYLIIDGRKWRTSNPAIPPKLRQELVDELMDARRAVRAKEPDARPRVNNAKVALGERGAPWWEPLDGEQLTYRILATTRALLSKRAGASICPSDVARVVANPGTDWRDLMDAVRTEAAKLVVEGEVKVLQRGAEVDALTAKGPIRIYPVSPPEEDLLR